MRGIAQLDGRPLLPPGECYRFFNAIPLNYGRWVGQNSGPILAVREPKVFSAGVSVFLQRHFPIDDVLLCFEDIRDIVMKLSEIVLKFRFWVAKFRVEGTAKFLTELRKSGSTSNMW